MTAATFQPMPELTGEQLEALRADIAEHGVIVPVVVDQHGRTLDGHNRQRIAAELGIDCPTEVQEVADDDVAMNLALTLNCARRHLTREQTREVIRGEIARRPNDSDRAIARRVGCSPSTVGVVRKPEASNLDSRSTGSNEPVAPLTEAELEALHRSEDAIREGLMHARGALYAVVGLALTNGVTVPEVVASLTMARLRFEQEGARDPDATDIFRRLVFDYVTEVVTWPETLEQYPVHPDSDPTPEERAMMLQAIVDTGLPSGEHPADLATEDA